MEWYDSRENLANLARYIIDENGSESLDVVYFLEKPWKWTEEWNQYQEACFMHIKDQTEKELKV